MTHAIITFDDVVSSQLDTAVPILQRHGFLATFFVCDWFCDSRTNPLQQGMKTTDLLTLHQLGYELGNHTVHHQLPEELSLEENRKEIEGIEALMAGLHLPFPTSYAYPGGPYSEKAAQILREKHYLGARTTGDLPIPANSPDCLKLPSFAINSKNPSHFAQAVAHLRQGHSVILTYHGIPDVEHPWCNVTPEDFASHMQALHDLHVSTPTLSQFIRQLA